AFGQIPARPVTPEELEALYSARADSALTRFSSADVAFVSGMIHHHAQAITMSEMAPTHGASEVVRTLAARIINGQVDEIVTMQEWLADRGQPVPAVPEIEPHLPPGVTGGAAGPAPTGDHAEHMPAMSHDVTDHS